MRFNNRSEAALYVWDYFYVTEVPARGDEKPWAFIERAVCRIREVEHDLDPPTPIDVRLRSARRLRSAVRVAMKHIAQLTVKPAPWVIAELAAFEVVADATIEALAAPARSIVLD